MPGYDCRFGTIVDSTLFHSMPVGSHESMVTSQRYVDGLSPKTAPRQRKTRLYGLIEQRRPPQR